MATKTISITEEAYSRLNALKNSHESFSIVIQRITNKASLSDIQGILSKVSANKLERNIKRTRKERAKSRNKRMLRIKEDMNNGLS